MSTEYVLLLGIYGFILLGAFVGDKGPGATFQEAGPRLGARVERNLATGRGFKNALTGNRINEWSEPKNR
ncbi:MAG: hypothetical protein AABZ31_08420 [Bdellovibrionota bacterium]